MNRRLLGLGLLVLVCLISACGGAEKTSELTTNTKALQLITAADVSKEPADSPQRALLRWWQLLQFRNIEDSLAAFRPDLRPGLRKAGYQDLLFRDLGPWIARAAPKIVSVERSGTHGVVFMRVVVNDPVGPDLVRKSEQFVGISLDRIGGRWLVSDASFPLQQSAQLRKTRLENEKSQARP